MRNSVLLLLFFLCACPFAAFAAPSGTITELPSEKFRVSRIGHFGEPETTERFYNLWFLLKQQYDFTDGKFTSRKDNKTKSAFGNAGRFPFHGTVTEKISDRTVLCRLTGPNPLIVAIEIANAPEVGQPVAAWVMPASAEKHDGKTYPKFREMASGRDGQLQPVPAEADMQKAFISAIEAGKTFSVNVVETRKCTACYGKGTVDEKVSMRLVPNKVTCETCGGAGRRTVKVRIVLQK